MIARSGGIRSNIMGKGAQGTVQIQKCVESINRYAFEDDNFLPFALLEKSNRSLLQCDKARRACDKILKNEFIRLGEASYWWCVSVSSFPSSLTACSCRGKGKNKFTGKLMKAAGRSGRFRVLMLFYLF